MRILGLIFVGLILSSKCLGQNSLFTNDDRFFGHQAPKFIEFISSLKAKNSSDRKLVRRLFTNAHNQFLKNYKAYSQVKDIFEKGYFDCLSGTYFLARSLDELNLKYKIFETNYHVFIIVETRQGEILLESTDREMGMITDRMMIREKISGYQQSRTNQGPDLYLSKLKMFHELPSSQLPGLLYFNRAVEAFNKNQLSDCCFYLEHAWKIYDNQRIEVFTPILIRSIEVSDLDTESKNRLTATLHAHLQSSLYSIASR